MSARGSTSPLPDLSRRGGAAVRGLPKNGEAVKGPRGRAKGAVARRAGGGAAGGTLPCDAKLDAILRNVTDAIITVDACGLIQSVNPATERMFGYAREELIGQNVGSLMPSPHREQHDEHIARYLRTGETRVIGVGCEIVARRKDGSVFPVDLSVDEVETGALFMGIIRDISERKLGEARVHSADRMASIGTLAAGLGHDMNNVLLPVRARLGKLRAAGSSGKIAAPERREIEAIGESVAYLQQLADGLHFLAMDPDQDGGERVASTDLHTWWSHTGPLLSKAVPKHVRVTASFPPGLSPAGVAVHGLTQAVLNLVVNAGDAIPHGRKRKQGRVHLWAEESRDGRGRPCVSLNVRDNGRGMSEEVKRRAFEIFFTTKPRGLGTGLGLPLVHKVVDRAGGSVEIEPRVDHGTTVTMMFPVAVGPPARHAAHGPRAVISVQDGRAAGLLRHLLEAEGARVRVGQSEARADVWVADPVTVSAERGRAWRAQHPRGRLVLFGNAPEPEAGAWGELSPLRIAHRDDLGAVRRAVGEAMKGP